MKTATLSRMSTPAQLAAVAIAVLAVTLGPLLLLNAWRRNSIWSALLVVAVVAATLRSTGVQALESSLWSPVYGVALVLLGLFALVSPEPRWRRRLGGSLAPVVLLLGFVAYSLTVSLLFGELDTVPVVGLLLILFALIAAYIFRWGDSDLLWRDARAALDCVVVLVCFSVALGLAGVSDAFGYYGRLQGLWGNPNYLALASALLLVYETSRLLRPSTTFVRMLNGLVLVIGFVALIWSGSRGGAAAAFFGVVVCVLIQVRNPLSTWRVVVVALGVVAVGLAGRSSVAAFLRHGEQFTSIDSGRTEIWSEFASQLTFFGSGLFSTRPVVTDETAALMYEVNPQADLAPHNIFLQVAVEVGMIGLLLFTTFLLVTIFARSRVYPHALLIGLVATALAYELSESSVFAAGGPLTLIVWTLILMLGRAGTSLPRLENQPAHVGGVGGRGQPELAQVDVGS